MKQLKFMLAAATAISLATAAQADALSSQNFEDMGDVTTSVPADVDNKKGFSYPAADGGNSSVIAQDANTTDYNKVLNVDTAGKPLLYNITGVDNKSGEVLSGEPGETKSVVIETDVKFTVTAADQTVDAGTEDKLMIYLKQFDAVTGEDGSVTTPATTKLMVKAAKQLTKKDGIKTITYFKADETAVSNYSVEPGVWYKLKVEALKNTEGDLVFNISLKKPSDSEFTVLQCNEDSAFLPNALDQFPSLQLDEDNESLNKQSLQYVGFAGEGYVDNIVVTKEVNEVTPVDFTFALTWTDKKISAVAYTTGGDITRGENITGYEANGEVVLTITPASWYKLVTEGAVTLTLPAATPEEAISLDEYVTEAANVTTGDDGKVTVAVTENTKPSDVGVMAGSFSAAAPAELSKALTWALNKGGATTAAGAGSVVGNLNFANEEDTDAEKAYLLDCTEAELTGEDGEIAKFKFVGFDLTTGFTVGKEKQVANGAAYGNGYVEVRGDTAVNGAYTEAANTAMHSFFKAFLVPFQPAAAEVE